MSKCLYCDKVCKQTPGRRARIFCDGNCRASYWQKEKSRQKRLSEGKSPKNSDKKQSKEMQENVPRETNEIKSYNFEGFSYEKIIMPIIEGPYMRKLADRNINNLINTNRTQYSDIELKIALIKDETIPPERDTIMGRKVWKAEQEKRIKEFEELLK